MAVTIYGQYNQSDNGVVAIVVADTVAELEATSSTAGSLGIALDQVGGIVYQYNGTAWTTVGHYQQEITPAEITSNQNNYNPTNLSRATMVRVSSDDVRQITGLAGGSTGRVILLVNHGTSNILLTHESSSSSAANRFVVPGASTYYVLPPEDSVLLSYDSTDSRWRVSGMTELLFSNAGTLTDGTAHRLNTVPPLLLAVDTSTDYASLTIDGLQAPTEVPFPWVPMCKIKTADEVVNNSTTLQNDNHLSMSVVANAVYFFELLCRWTGTGATHDAKIGWTYPTGATMEWGGAYGTTNNQSTFLGSSAGVTATPNTSLIETNTDPFGSAATNHGSSWAGYLITGANAGTFQLQWAQNTAVATDLTLRKYSLLKLTRIV